MANLPRFDLAHNNKERRQFDDKLTRSYPPIKLLPKQLLLDVVGRVTPDSLLDLHKIKLCSKDLFESTEHNYVFKRVTLRKFQFLDWFPNVKKMCSRGDARKGENPESLYREGFHQLFGY